MVTAHLMCSSQEIASGILMVCVGTNGFDWLLNILPCMCVIIMYPLGRRLVYFSLLVCRPQTHLQILMGTSLLSVNTWSTIRGSLSSATYFIAENQMKGYYIWNAYFVKFQPNPMLWLFVWIFSMRRLKRMVTTYVWLGNHKVILKSVFVNTAYPVPHYFTPISHTSSPVCRRNRHKLQQELFLLITV